MAGRPPTPIAIKQLTGNPGKRAIPADVPTPAAGLGKPPTWLSKDARRHWRQIEPLLSSLGVLAVPDTLAFALLCDALAEYTAARQVIAENGATYMTVNTMSGIVMHRTRPEVGVAADAWRRINSMLGQFGMTPSARVKLAGAVADVEDDPMEELLRGRRGA